MLKYNVSYDEITTLSEASLITIENVFNDNNNNTNLMPSISFLSLGLAERITMSLTRPGLTPCIWKKRGYQ